MRAQQQVMYHPQHDIQIPLDMQHRSLTLKGHIRMTVEEPHVVRMTKTHLDESLQNLQHGWQRTPTGLPVGYHISNTDVNPLDYHASYGEFRGTSLIQFDHGHWELIETREKMEDMIFSDLTFEQPGMRGVITILSDDATTPEQMGCTFEGKL